MEAHHGAFTSQFKVCIAPPPPSSTENTEGEAGILRGKHTEGGAGTRREGREGQAHGGRGGHTQGGAGTLREGQSHGGTVYLMGIHAHVLSDTIETFSVQVLLCKTIVLKNKV